MHILGLVNKRGYKFIFSGIILIFLAGCSGDFREFWDDPSYRTQDISPSYRGATVRFLGVSSFLIKDGDATIMIDGYLSRPNHILFERIAPDQAQIKKILCAINLKLNEECANKTSNRSNLDAVFAMHGHFDHALDSPLVACLTGATLVGGPVVAEIKKQTKLLFPDRCQQINYEKLEESLTEYSFVYDQMSVTLVRVPHSKNIASEILEHVSSDEDWTFPALITEMKEGIGVAAHVKLPQGRILIVPTAGDINEEFYDKRFEADTVFLGIGALGFTDKDTARKYWDNTVVATHAKWVIPIHWDTLTGPLDPKAATLNIPFYERLDLVLHWFQKFSEDDPDVTLRPVVRPVVRPIPLVNSFDPFFQN